MTRLRDRCAGDAAWRDSCTSRDRRTEKGAALIAALVLLMMMSVVGLGLALTTGVEPAIASAHESSLTGVYAAEAGLAVAIRELRDIADWSLVLSGQVRSAIFQSSPDASLALPDRAQVDLSSLTNQVNCGHPAACTTAELDAFSAERPWGANNPRWQLFGHARLNELEPAGAGVRPCEVVVWVADDPAELDGDPLRDSQVTADGAHPPGAGIVVVRAESFGTGSAHRVLVQTVARPPAAGAAPLLLAWREIR